MTRPKKKKKKRKTCTLAAPKRDEEDEGHQKGERRKATHAHTHVKKRRLDAGEPVNVASRMGNHHVLSDWTTP
jgi:hypothetical protein